MPVTKDSYDSFLESVLAKVPAEAQEVVKAAFTEPHVAAELRESVLARTDYSQKMDAFDAEVAEARQNIADWQDWYAGQVTERTKLDADLKAYQETYGDLENPMTKPNETPKGLTTEELQSHLATRDQLAIKFADMLTDIKLDHQRDFGERLDSSALMEYATKKGLPLDLAYRDLVAPKVEERRAADLTKRIDEAREEGRRAALTEHRLPITPPHREAHVLERQGEVKKTSSERVAAAVARFNAGVGGR